MQQSQPGTDQLTVLTSLARIVTATLDVETMLSAITDCLQQGFGYNNIELYLLDDATGDLVLSAQAGPYRYHSLGRRQPISLGIMGRTVRSCQPQRVDDVQLDDDYCTGNPASRSELCVPIAAGGRVLGLINLESEAIAAFTDEDLATLSAATDILAGAMENARLSRRAQEAAVLEERNRLARELHDSVTQQLFSIMLTAQAARAHLEKDPQRAAAKLERLQETAQAALAEMRALIGQLRPPDLADRSLVSALQTHIAALSRREGLRIELRVTGSERLAQGYEQALYRIVQEALNNIIKHAAASQASVLLTCSPEQVQLTIRDDGRGFDSTTPLPESGRHLGLLSMRERAAEIGGTLSLQSQPDHGTTLIVTVPRTSPTRRSDGNN
jgi:signal transduction histidine kinase